MAKLFVIRKRDPKQLRLAESLDGASILLLQDGVYLTGKTKATTFVSAEDARKRGVKLNGAESVGYAEIVSLLLEKGHTVVNL